MCGSPREWAVVTIVACGKPERKEVKAALEEARSKQIDVAQCTSEVDEVRTGKPVHVTSSFDHQHI